MSFHSCSWFSEDAACSAMEIGLCLNWDVPHAEGNGLLSAPEADPLENLLIEHPSMSVYQMRRRRSEVEEEEEDTEEEDNSPRFFQMYMLDLKPLTNSHHSQVSEIVIMSSD